VRTLEAWAYISNRLKRELDPRLAYHRFEHTVDVVAMSSQMGMAAGLTKKELDLLITAAWFHDCGFLFLRKAHELEGCMLVTQVLPRFDFEVAEIEFICGMIMATRIPQTPNNKLEAILCDADLDYLGRDDFYTIGDSLFTELSNYGDLTDEVIWNKLQVSFLEKHKYQTAWSTINREPEKQARLVELRAWLAGDRFEQRKNL
jgi:uncharacterized protein